MIGDLLHFSLLSVAREYAIEHVVPESDSELPPADNDGIGERLKQDGSAERKTSRFWIPGRVVRDIALLFRWLA